MREEESASQVKSSSLFTNINDFFHLPNPRILTLFITSSTATFTLGIALIVEWAFYGQHHPGYHWIAYYSSFLIVLPILILITSTISANFLHKKDQNLHTLPLFEHSKSKRQQTDADEEVQALQGHLALVKIGNLNDDPSGFIIKDKEPLYTSLMPAAGESDGKNDNPALKRTFSLPLTNTSTYYSNIKRTMSFR